MSGAISCRSVHSLYFFSLISLVSVQGAGYLVSVPCVALCIDEDEFTLRRRTTQPSPDGAAAFWEEYAYPHRILLLAREGHFASLEVDR